MFYAGLRRFVPEMVVHLIQSFRVFTDKTYWNNQQVSNFISREPFNFIECRWTEPLYWTNAALVRKRMRIRKSFGNEFDRLDYLPLIRIAALDNSLWYTMGAEKNINRVSNSAEEFRKCFADPFSNRFNVKRIIMVAFYPEDLSFFRLNSL